MREARPRRDGRSRARGRAFGVLALFWAVVVVKVLVLRWTVLGGGRLPGALSEVAGVTFALVLVDLLFPDLRFRALLIADAALSALLTAIAMYVSYYGLLPTPESVKVILQAATVGSSVGQIVQPVHVLLFADLPFLLAWGWLRRRRRGALPEVLGSGLPYAYLPRWVYLSLLPLGLAIALAIGGVLALPTPVDGMAVSRQRGLLTYLVSSVVPRAKPVGIATSFADVRAAQRAIDGLKGGTAGERIADFPPGAAKGRNVIVIQMEAAQALLVGARVGGVEVTPNLNRLVARSWYFPNAVSQVGHGTSSDAEFIANTSLLPSEEGAAALIYTDHELSSMPRVLRALGYDAFTFHTNDVRYWNRSQLYPAIGFTRYYDRRFFGNEDIIDFGPSDMVLFRRTLAELERRDRGGTPFYAQVMTMSAHHPFNGVPEAQRRLKLTPDLVGTTAGDYLVEQEYADRALGTFVDGLEKDGLLDRTVLVLYGDHFGLKDVQASGREADALRTVMGRTYTAMDRMNVPLVVHMPGQSAGHRVGDTVGQVDVMPTIADALGVDLGGTVHFGRDAFVRSPVLLPAGGFLPVGSYLDDRVLYVPGDTFGAGTVWDIGAHRTGAFSGASRTKYESTLEMLRLSDEYTRSLPQRADFDPGAKAVLPTQ